MCEKSNMIDLPTSNHERLVTPILNHDEYCAKADNLTSLSRALIRNTLYRSVSFMKKSFNRSNSSLSTGSLHSGSMHSVDSAFSADDSLNNTNHTNGRRSCLKGTRLQRENSKPMRIRFKRSHDKIYKIEPYFEYAKDLWYTRADERDVFSQPGLETVADTARAEKFMRAYTQARKQVYPKAWFEGKNPVPSKPEKLSTALYDEIVVGKIYGFAGLDQYSFNLKKTRRIHIHHTVLLITAAYFDCGNNNEGSLDDKAKLVRSYSRSLSAVDRYWSTAIGQSDADAAAEVYKEDTMISEADVEDDEDNVTTTTKMENQVVTDDDE